jgi:RNA polymerase sigma-70 factor (ECF subfamily)
LTATAARPASAATAAPAAAIAAVPAITEHMPALRRYFARRAPKDDVDDLVQEVFLRMQPSVDLAAIEHLEHYLFRVASNVLTDRARRAAVRHARQHESLEEFHHPVEERSPERILIDQEALNRMVAAIGRLHERTRDIFVLHRFEELSCSSIAAQLGLSTSAVEKHIMKALVCLRNEMTAS